MGEPFYLRIFTELIIFKVGIQGVVGQPSQLLLLHLPAALTQHPPDLYLHVDTGIPTGQVPYPAHLVVVERSMYSAAGTAEGFSPRRWSWRTRTFGSPKTPRTVDRGRNPGKQYVSSSRRCFRIRGSCHVFSRLKTCQILVQSHFSAISHSILPTQIREEPFK